MEKIEQSRTRTWTAILYINEEGDRNGHNAFLSWLTTSSHYVEYAFIHHKPDNDEGKEHTHLVLRFPQKIRFNGVNKFCGGALNENLLSPVSSVPGYGIYLLHRDFNSVRSNKIQYDATDLFGTGQLLEELLVDSVSHEVPLFALSSIIRQYDINSFSELVSVLCEVFPNSTRLVDYVSTHTQAVNLLIKDNECKRLRDIQKLRRNYQELNNFLNTKGVKP